MPQCVMSVSWSKEEEGEEEVMLFTSLFLFSLKKSVKPVVMVQYVFYCGFSFLQSLSLCVSAPDRPTFNKNGPGMPTIFSHIASDSPLRTGAFSALQ